MNRTAALDILTNEYAELVTSVQFDAGQVTTAYTFAIDMALRQLGVQETDVPTWDVPQAQITGYLALLHYYALKRFSRALSTKFDVQIAGSLNAMRSQAFKQVQMLMEEAEKECAALGYGVGSTQSMQFGRVELDFLEPDLPYLVDYGGGWF
jgi:hypothetical protein